MNPNLHIKKLFKTIKSCKTIEQLKGAIRLIELYDSRESEWLSYFDEDHNRFPLVHRKGFYDHTLAINLLDIVLREQKKKLSCCGDWDEFGNCKCK